MVGSGRKIDSITDVAERQLCTGCGVCAFVQPQEIRMVDDFDAGRRPIVLGKAGEQPPPTDAALRACPGVGLTHDPDPPGADQGVREAWGPVLKVWEGYAADSEIRHAASSGGIATALSLYCIEYESMHGVLHIRARRDAPYLNETVLSHSRDGMLAATGSRYSPASPCDRLDLVRDGPSPSVFIGKPCDVAATAKARRYDTKLDEKVGLTIGIFCAGTPTTRGTIEMLRAMGVTDPATVRAVRYRGNGWPGNAAVDADLGGTDHHAELTYGESWGKILESHRQWRCYVCADHTSEFADVAVGDPWYVEPDGRDPGRSLIVARSERGRQIVESAITAGVIIAHPVTTDHIPASQPELLRVRGSVWGRIAMSRLVGIPAPRFEGLPTFHIWLHHLTVEQRVRSTVGLLRRVGRKGLRRRHPVIEFTPKQR